MGAADAIRTVERPECLLCGRAGAVRFARVADRIYDAPGSWRVRECGACGVAWLDPQPVPEDLHRLYLDYYTHEEATPPGPPSLRERAWATNVAASFGYAAEGAVPLGRVARALAGLRPVRELVEADVMGLGAGERGRLLEVGCGSGGFLDRMRRFGWEVEGVEPDAAAVEVARTRYGLEVREGVLETAGFEAERFDAVTMSHVVEHLPDPLATLRHARTLLRPGGALSLVTPNTGSLGRRLFGESWLHWDPPRHLHVFSAASLAELVRRAGFRVESVRTPTRGARWAFAASRRIRRDGRFPGATAGRLRRSEKLAGALFQLVEAAIPGRARMGEELLLVARREG